MENVTNSLGFYLDYGNGRKVLTPLAQVYSGYLDAACYDIVTGAFDYNSVLRRVVTQLTNSGLRKIDYASGRADRVDVAARRAVMTAVSQITGKISEYNAQKLGTEYFEVEWHAGARPTHAVWQGHVWSKQQLYSVCGLGTVTGLLGVNCYHTYYPFFPGLSERNWSDEWLDAKNLEESEPKKFGDKEYTLASLTAVLDGPNDLAQEGANANEILIPKMSMSGLADYDKQTGYALGDVTLDYETKKCDYDRGRMFTVDAMDNIESAGIAFGRLSGEFLRTQVVPELDTWRLAKYAGYASGNNVVTGAIADGKAGIAAIRAGKTAIKNAEAKTETCYLFISTTLKGMIDDLDTTASKKAMEDWAGVIEVPASRFFDKVTLTKTGAGGFATTGGKAIDFLIVDKNAAIQYQKHTVSKIITPEQNQTRSINSRHANAYQRFRWNKFEASRFNTTCGICNSFICARTGR